MRLKRRCNLVHFFSSASSDDQPCVLQILWDMLTGQKETRKEHTPDLTRESLFRQVAVQSILHLRCCQSKSDSPMRISCNLIVSRARAHSPPRRAPLGTLNFDPHSWLQIDESGTRPPV